MKKFRLILLALIATCFATIEGYSQDILDSLEIIYNKVLNGEEIQNVATEQEDNENGSQSILVIGDSTLDGIGRRFTDYASCNGHTIFTSIWYGATTKDWAYTTELPRLIKKVKPTFIIISLGTNDLGYNDISARTDAVKEILREVGDIPYIWIGPMSLRTVRDGTKIVNAIRDAVGENLFFDSYHRKMTRLADGIHPTFEASARWVDDVVKWMNRPEAIHHITMNYPTASVPFKSYETHKNSYKGKRK